MPLLDEFSESFNSAYGIVSQRRSDRERTRAQSEHWKAEEAISQGALDIQKSEEERAQEQADYDKTQRAAAEEAKAAEAALARQNAALVEQQAITAKWKNDPKQQEIDTNRALAEIDNLVSQGKLNNANADLIAAQLPHVPAKMVADINRIVAETAGLNADAAAKWIDNELKHMELLAPARKLFDDFFGGVVPPPAAGFKGPEGAEPVPDAEGAIPEQGGAITSPLLSRPTAPLSVQPVAQAPNSVEAVRPTQVPQVPGVVPSTPRPEYSGSPSPTAAPATPGPTAGPATRPAAAIPPADAAAGSLSNTYPVDAETTPPYRANEPYLPTPTRPTPADARRNNIMGVEKTSYQGGGQGNVIEAQSGTRRLPLNERTRGMLEQASATTGYDVRVTSGAQPSSGKDRVGGHRHDTEIGAGDIQLIDRETGKPVSMATEEGQQAIIEFMRAARDAGATGFGAGTDYMGDTTIHVGFGNPGVWGAGGKRDNAPDWLVAGMEGGVGGRPSAIPQGIGARSSGVARAYQGLQARDMPQMQAAILAGNIQQESNGDPNSVNEKEGAEGVIQWRQDRLEKLKAFANEQGKDYRDLDVQLDFVVEEGENRGSAQDKAAWQEFMSATTPEAANAALKKFIRYGDDSAGTRLEYAENLLRGGGGEIRGEKVASEATTGKRMPTPRGEVASNVRRKIVYATATEASKEGLKAIYAGLETQPGIPTPDRDQQLRNVVASKDAPPPAEMASAKEAVQKTAKEPMSEAELNASTLAYAYKWALLRGDKDKAALVAKEILQSYTQTANRYASIAQLKAQNGQLSEAAQVMIKAYAYIPDGKEATVTEEDGKFILTTKDSVTDKLIQQQVLTPDQMYAGIMGWQGTVDVHKRLRAAAGEAMPSSAFEKHSAEMSQAIPETPPGTPVGTTGMSQDTMMRGAPPVGGEPPAIPDVAAMNEAERSAALDVTKFATAQRDETRKAAFGKAFTSEERESVDAEIAAAKENIPEKFDALIGLFPDNPGKVEDILYSIQQMNPNVAMQTIVNDLGDVATNGTADNPVFQFVGQTSETVSAKTPDGPVLNMPTNTFTTIWNALMRKTPAGIPVDPHAARNADTEAEGVAAEIATSGARPSAVPPPPATYTDPRAPGIPTAYPPERDPNKRTSIPIFTDRYNRRGVR